MDKLGLLDNSCFVDREKPYTEDTFREVAVGKLEKLYKVRDLMERKEYKREKRKFEKEQNRLIDIIDSFSNHIRTYEEEITEKIMNNDSLTMEQKEQKLRDEVYPKVQERNEELEKNTDYKKAVENHQIFLANNEMMSESTLYELKRTSPKIMPFVDLTSFLAGDENAETIEVEMPSDCIYDEIEKQEKYIAGEYVDDYVRAVKEDFRQKQLSKLQLDYLFDECDTVCFHAEKNMYFEKDIDERFAKIVEKAYKDEFIENWGMQTLRIYLKPTEELKEYLMSFVKFDRYHYDTYERFAPYVFFGDILFLKGGEPLLNCLTHEGYFDVGDSVKDVFEKFEASLN